MEPVNELSLVQIVLFSILLLIMAASLPLWYMQMKLRRDEAEWSLTRLTLEQWEEFKLRATRAYIEQEEEKRRRGDPTPGFFDRPDVIAFINGDPHFRKRKRK